MGDVLITGAAGQVAGMIRPYLRARYDRLVLTDRRDPPEPTEGEEVRLADLGDAEALAAALEGVSAIVHLGGQAVDAPWETVLPANVTTLVTLYETARAAGVERIVFASSVHAVGFHPRHARIGTETQIRPDGAYGTSKAFGEALTTLMADKHGLRTLSIRIGNVNPEPIDLRRLSIWVHPEDLAQLCAIGLEHPDVAGEVVYGVSDNARSWWDNGPAHRLGYRPRHRSEDFAAEVLARPETPDPVGDHFQGGSFCSDGFTGDVERTRWR
jgi:uronate dehydrogenase